MTYKHLGMIVLLFAACTEEPGLGVDQLQVIRGTPTPDGMFPATGALLSDLGSGLETSCTGTLISPTAVLTAGHCVLDIFTGGPVPSFTLLHEADGATAGDIYAGASQHVHPGFDFEADPGDGVRQWNDLAILLLQEPVAIDPAEIAILPNLSEIEALTVGTPLDLVGYGLTTTGGGDVGIKHHGIGDLRELGSHELFISEDGQQQNCNGDSGGPAMAELGHGPRIVGIVSRSPDGDPVCDHGGIDTRVDAYLEWIHSLVEVECGGLEQPCDGEEGGGCCSASSGDRLPGSLLLLGLVAVVLTRKRKRR